MNSVWEELWKQGLRRKLEGVGCIYYGRVVREQWTDQQSTVEGVDVWEWVGSGENTIPRKQNRRQEGNDNKFMEQQWTRPCSEGRTEGEHSDVMEERTTNLLRIQKIGQER